MREIRTSGLMSGEGKRGVAARPKLPRPSSTLPMKCAAAPSIVLPLAPTAPRLSRLASGGEVAVLDQVGLLLRVARLELEQARRRAAQDVVLGLVGQERQIVDGGRQVEVPVRIV